MTRKEKFLRAIQQVDSRHAHDLPLAFRWALNLKEKTIPADVNTAARKFVGKICETLRNR